MDKVKKFFANRFAHHGYRARQKARARHDKAKSNFKTSSGNNSKGTAASGLVNVSVNNNDNANPQAPLGGPSGEVRVRNTLKRRIHSFRVKIDSFWTKVHNEKAALAKMRREVYGNLLQELCHYKQLAPWKQIELEVMKAYFKRENLREQLHDQDDILQSYIDREVALSEGRGGSDWGIWSRADGSITIRISERSVALHTADMVYCDTAAIIPMRNQLVLWTDASGPDSHALQDYFGIGVVLKSVCDSGATWHRLLSAGTYLSGFHSIQIAELRAVASALGHATKISAPSLIQPYRYPIDVVKVFSDSVDSLRMIRNYLIFPDDICKKGAKQHPLATQQFLSAIHDIKAHASELVDRDIKVEFHWVPGHSGIEGNTRADEMARHARITRKERRWIYDGTPVIWRS